MKINSFGAERNIDCSFRVLATTLRSIISRIFNNSVRRHTLSVYPIYLVFWSQKITKGRCFQIGYPWNMVGRFCKGVKCVKSRFWMKYSFFPAILTKSFPFTFFTEMDFVDSRSRLLLFQNGKMEFLTTGSLKQNKLWTSDKLAFPKLLFFSSGISFAMVVYSNIWKSFK